MPLPTADGFRGIWYMNQPQNDEYRYKYSGGFATYPQQHIPLAVHRPEVKKTIFVYGGAGRNDKEIQNCVSVYDHATGTVANPRIVLTRNTNDAHYNPTLGIDAEGHVHVFCNSHGQGAELSRTDPTFGKSFVYRSEKPYSIDSFEKVREDNFSYSQVHPYQKGFLWLHTRYAGNVRRLFWSRSSDGRQWTEPKQVAAMGQGSYQISGSHNNRIATALDYHPPRGGLNARTNIYYLETGDGGETWTDVTGKPVSLPIKDVKNPTLLYDFESDGLLVYLKDLAFDKDGHPVILYLTAGSYQPGPAGGERAWYTSRWTGTEWQTRLLTRSDHNYDHGSLYIEGSTWRVIAPTEPGPQPEATGGAIAVWTTDNQGATWTREKLIGAFNDRNQTYVRRPLNAHEGFYAYWADANSMERSESDLYFATKDGTVYRLPRTISGDSASPERVAG